MILIYDNFPAEHRVHSVDRTFSKRRMIWQSVYSVENRSDKIYWGDKALLYKWRLSQQYEETANKLLHKRILLYLEYNHFQDFVEYTTLSSDISLRKSWLKQEEMLLLGL